MPNALERAMNTLSEAGYESVLIGAFYGKNVVVDGNMTGEQISRLFLVLEERSPELFSHIAIHQLYKYVEMCKASREGAKQQ